MAKSGQKRMSGTTPDKLKPHNVEAEEAVLGSLLVSPDAIMKVASFLKPEDFYVERHSWIYKAIKDLHDKGTPADFITLTDELERQKQLEEIGGSAYLTDLINATPTSIHVEFYARIVERTGVLRRLIDAAGEITKIAYDDSGELQEILDEAGTIITPVLAGNDSNKIVHVSDPSVRVLDRADEIARNGVMPGITTGIPALDKRLKGFGDDQHIIIAGRPAMGKTTLALQCALWAAWGGNPIKPPIIRGRNIGIMSFEMSDEQISTKLLSHLSEIDSNKIRNGEVDDWEALLKARAQLDSMGIFIKEDAGPNIHQVRNAAMEMVYKHGIEMLIIDYLQLMSGTNKKQNREQEISEISRGLKILNSELKIPVIALSQLNRELERRQNKRPLLADLRESGSIEQNANVVIFIYRDEVYNPDTEFANIAEISVAKNREGDAGFFVSSYYKKVIQRFVELETRVTSLDF